MLLGRLWLKDATFANDWGNNIITIHGNVTIITIEMIKHLGSKVKNHKSYCALIIRMASQKKK
jgi:hypothetical protein